MGAVPRVSSNQTQLRTLGPLFCWAIVYADIGTSIYYVPGLLFRSVGTSAATFVLATSLAFVLLAEKYSEIAPAIPAAAASSRWRRRPSARAWARSAGC